MTWATPPVLTDGQVLTGAHTQTWSNDLLETAPAKATTAGSWFIGNGLNSIVERVPGTNYVAASETSTSTAYTALTTPGPALTVTTGTRAVVILCASVVNNTGGANAYMSYAVSGATTILSVDDEALYHRDSGATGGIHATYAGFPSLTAGSNTFTCQYRVSSGTGTFTFRRLIVLPL